MFPSPSLGFIRFSFCDTWPPDLGWLFVGYEESAWYWELVVHVRKVAICVVVASRLAAPAVQMQAVLGLIGVALLLHCLVQPHEQEVLNDLETISLGTTFLTAWLGLLYAQAAGEGPVVAISAAVLVLNVLCLLLFLLALRAQWRRDRGLQDAGAFGSVVAMWQLAAAKLLERWGKKPEQEHEQEQEPSKPPSPAAKAKTSPDAGESRSGVYQSSTPPLLSGHDSPKGSDMAPFRGAHSPPGLPPRRPDPFLRRPSQLGPLAETFSALRSRHSEPGEDSLTGFGADSPLGRSLHTLTSPLLRRTSARVAPDHSPPADSASPPRRALAERGCGGPVEGEAPPLP